MKNELSKILITTLLLAQACGQLPTTQSTASADEIPCTAGSDGDGRLERVCTPVDVIKSSDSALTTSLTIVDTAFKLTLLATLKPPTTNGTTLQATDVILGSANQAIVSFNVAGNTQLGALDLIDVSDVAKPSLRDEMVTTSIDMNAIARSGNRLYATGASTTQGAVLNTLDIKGDKFDDHSLQTSVIPSYAGTSVAVRNGVVAVASGDTGGIQLFSASTALTTATVTKSVSDARSVRYDNDGNKLYVLSGQPGTVRVYKTDGTLTATHNLGGNTVAESKSTIEMHDDVYVASLGDAGAKIVCNADGGVLATVAPIAVASLAASKTVTNAASMYNGLLFTANGEAGVTVYAVKTSSKKVGACNAISVSQVGTLSLGANFSANHVRYSNGNLFVASGTGGLEIIRVKYTCGLDDFLTDLLSMVGVDWF